MFSVCCMFNVWIIPTTIHQGILKQKVNGCSMKARENSNIETQKKEVQQVDEITLNWCCRNLSITWLVLKDFSVNSTQNKIQIK